MHVHFFLTKLWCVTPWNWVKERNRKKRKEQNGELFYWRCQMWSSCRPLSKCTTWQHSSSPKPNTSAHGLNRGIFPTTSPAPCFRRTWCTKMLQNFEDLQNKSRIPLTIFEFSPRIPHLFPSNWNSEIQDFELSTLNLYVITLTKWFIIRLWRFQHSIVFFTAVEVRWDQLLPDPLRFFPECDTC